jgi:hypothetical protein
MAVKDGMKGRELMRPILLSSRRNWRRASTVSVVICIVVAFFVGAVASANAVAPAFLYRVLDETPIDLVAYPRRNADYHAVHDAIGLVSGVALVETAFQYRFERTNLDTKNDSARNQTLFLGGVALDVGQRLSGLTVVAGDWNSLAPYGAAIGASLAASLSVAPGALIWINERYYDLVQQTYVNVSLPVVVACTVELNGTAAEAAIPEYSRTYDAQYLLVSLDWAANLTGQLTLHPGSDYSSSFVQNVLVNREQLIDPLNIESSLLRTRVLAEHVADVDSGFALFVWDYLSVNIELVQTYVTSTSMGLGLFTLPLLAMGWYAVNTISWIQRVERRRELALLQIRGASHRQLRLLVLAEAAFASLPAILAGPAMGAVIGWALSCVLFSPTTSGAPVPFFIFAASVWQPAMLVLTGALSIGLAALGSASGLRIAGAELSLRPELVSLASSSSKRLSLGWSYLVLCLGLVRILLAVLGVPPVIPGSSGNVLFFVIESLLYQIDVVWLPLAPLLVLIAAVIILVRQGNLLERVSSAFFWNRFSPAKTVVPRRISEQKEIVMRTMGLVSSAVLLLIAMTMILATERALSATWMGLHLPGIEEAEAMIQGLMQFGVIEASFVWLLALTGVGYVMAAYLQSQRSQFALLIGRGATGKQLRRIVLAETGVVLLIAVLLGVSLGVSTAVGFEQQLSFVRRIESFPLVFPLDGFLLTAAFVATLLVIVLLFARRISTRRLIEVLPR